MADFSLSQGLREGEGWHGAGWLNLLSGRWAAQGSFSLWRLFLTLVLFSSPQHRVLGLTGCSGPGLWGTLLHRSQASFTDWTEAAELEEENRMKVEREGGGSLTCPHHGAGQNCHLVGRNHYIHWISHNWWYLCEFSSLRDWEVGNGKDPNSFLILPKISIFFPLCLQFSTFQTIEP